MHRGSATIKRCTRADARKKTIAHSLQNKPNYSTARSGACIPLDAAPRAASLNAQVSQGGSRKSNRYSRTCLLQVIADLRKCTPLNICPYLLARCSADVLLTASRARAADLLPQAQAVRRAQIERSSRTTVVNPTL